LVSPDSSNAERPRAQAFATTQWSQVLAAGGGDEPLSREALAELCRTYWYPLYAFVRRKGHAPQDAEDLTQEFFLRLMEQDWVARADQSKGRFRTFLLTVLTRFMANEWDKASRQKRGGHLRKLPLTIEDAEKRFSREPTDPRTPEQEFERQWALVVLDRVLDRLGEDYARRDQAALFETLKPSLIGDREAQPYQQLAADLDMTEGSVKVAVHRLRQRYRERLLEEIAQTVASPEEAESELRHLFRVLARP
jgi:RNA polymerase sigma factor (sigma-70 family)